MDGLLGGAGRIPGFRQIHDGLIRLESELTSPHPSDRPTSPTLLHAVVQGDAVGWERLVRIYGPLMVSWCRHCGLSEDDALDVAQESLLAVHAAIARFESRDGDGGFRGWLWTLTRNKVRDFARRRRGVPEATGGTEALHLFHELPAKPPQDAADIADLHLRLLEELRVDFKPDIWTAFWRVAVEGDAARDVAADMGISVWAIYKTKARVLSRLKMEFGEESPSMNV